MPKTLILHIGHYKTGTTALQVFFSQNHEFLTQHGVEYPDVWMHNSKHSAFAFSILRAAGVQKLMYDYRDPVTPQDMWNDLYQYIGEQENPYTLISSEEFMRMGQFPNAQDILRQVLKNRPDWLKIKVIAYLRDPATHLQSWYNQLIKMNFQVSDLDRAVNGDIEDIHYDYRRALAPWIDILGAENVMIRPYLKDLENPAALHQDFMAAFDIPLPAELVHNERDLNPRLDDRVIDLIRVMQNLDYPRSTINAICDQALTYLETQDRLLASQNGGISNAAARALDGLNWLADLPDNRIDTQAFAKNLPTAPDPEQTNQTLLLGFVYSELIQLRRRINKSNIPDLLSRIEALEHKLGHLENDV